MKVDNDDNALKTNENEIFKKICQIILLEYIILKKKI